MGSASDKVKSLSQKLSEKEAVWKQSREELEKQVDTSRADLKSVEDAKRSVESELQKAAALGNERLASITELTTEREGLAKQS